MSALMASEFAETRERDVLLWVQPVVEGRYHELRSRKGVHAKLKWKGMYGSLAYAHTSDGTFTLKRAGFLHPRVTVRSRPGDQGIATFEVFFGITGTIEFIGGPKYEVRRPKPLRREWTVADDAGRAVLTIKKKRNPNFAAEVVVKANPRHTKFLILLSAIVWYAFILSLEEWEMKPQESPALAT